MINAGGTGTPLTCVPTMPRMAVTGSVARVTSRPTSLAVVSVYLLRSTSSYLISC
jgi:hypothetical protein